MQAQDVQPLKPWKDLSSEDQLALRKAYQTTLDTQPATCSLDDKITRFAQWLEGRGIAFTAEDVSRK